MTDHSAGTGPRLRVGYVPGVQPDKWLTRWRERRPDVPVSARRDGDPRSGLAQSLGDHGAGPSSRRELGVALWAPDPRLRRVRRSAGSVDVRAELGSPPAGA